MESWRERGYVPDSDSEDGFDSQGTERVNQEVEDGGESTGHNVDSAVDLHAATALEPFRGDQAEDEEDHGDDVPPPASDPMELDEPKDEDTTPRRLGPAQPSPTLSAAPDNAESPSTPKAQPQKDIWDLPSSSPDELQLVFQPPRRQATPPTCAQEESQLPQFDDSNDISPLSSPPSSLQSISFDEDEQNDGERPNPLPRDVLEELEELLPLPPEIPEDILHDSSRPVGRRSLRQRNPIQLHPYMLEDAKYRNLMMQRGVKPVRIAQYREALRAAAAAGESQVQEFAPNPESPSGSSAVELGATPSSPLELDRHSGQIQQAASTHDGANPPQPVDSSPIRDARASKRRRISKHYGGHGGDHSRRPVVVVDNSSPVRRLDIPPSPPRSGSASSPHVVQRPNEFIWPRGFSPPSIHTPDTEPKIRDRFANEDAMDLSGPVEHNSSDDQSEASHSPPGSDVEQNGQDTNAVRQFQRKIKGVLPASWLRLDQQKQKDGLPSSTQRNLERAARQENAKGVAKKITKRNDTTTQAGSRGQLDALRQLADDDSDEERESNTPDVDAREILAKFVGSQDPFFEQDGGDDIPEDNRIDYMFESATRSSSDPRKQKLNKNRQSTGRGGIGSSDPLRKSRLKRQSRLTDSVYGGQRAQRERQPSRRSPPRLSVLDAPDVTARSRSEQPQFLRVAARNARFRQDRGRQSPTRKVFKLSSRPDSEDVNRSLRQWRSGGLRQTKLPQPRTRPQKRRPLADLPTNRQARSPAVDVDSMDEIRNASLRREQTPPPDVPAPVQTSNATQDVAEAARPQRQGPRWFVRRNIGVSSLSRDAPRPAGLEAVSSGQTGISATTFRRSLASLNRSRLQRPLPKSRPRNEIMDRFLSDGSSTPNTPDTNRVDAPENRGPSHDKHPMKHLHNRRRQLRKRTPMRLEIDASGSQDAPPLPSPEPENAGTGGSLQQNPGLLSGLQHSYSIDFNITPLATGTFFHESTFIGSGEFSTSLAAGKRNFDEATNSFSINLGQESCRWGPWNDTVSSEIGIAFNCMLNHNEGEEHADAVDTGEVNIGHIIYRQLIRYITESLTFIDPIDRKGFVQKAHSLVSKINDHLMTLMPTTAQEAGRLVKLASYNLVFANLTSQIACHDLVDNAIADETFELVKSSSRQVIALIISNLTGQASIRRFLGNNRSRAWREAGIRDDQPFVEAYVIVNHVLHSRDNLETCFAELVTDAHSLAGIVDLGELKDVSCLENGWQRVYATLPLNEIDPFGIARTGLRFKQPHENWAVVKKLLAPVLGSYDAHSDAQPLSYNSYCRALFHRCFYLINGWGWRDCRPILDTLYDFFAKNTLYNLKHEESYRSPAFLDELDRNPSLEVLPGDPCFHILLKIIASGLRFLSQLYDKKRVRNFAWRLLPNHGRVYPKEKSIHQTDLDALRNHHDLLCTLYYAVPDGCRPRIEAIKNLVHPGSSHRETCIISLRSWTRLARFKMSTEEDASGLEPFADWHCYFVAELLKQHGLARKEVESQSTADNQFSRQLIERTIAQNQQQIESLLKTALNSLQNIVQSASTLDHAYIIVSKTPINWVLGLFNSKAARLNTTVSEALQVIMAYIEKCNARPAPADTRAGPANGPAATDEDSQEYGDWRDLDFDAICGDEVSEARPEGIVHVEQVFHPAVSRLVSNCFGEDHSPEDAILLAVVDCWTSIAQILVQYRIRHWDSYMSPYDGDSWATLRGTMQTRKFTPRFLASCIDKDAQFVSDCRTQIFGMWMTSLVERVSMLKFQHCLTEALLNRDAQNPILHNLPFSKDVRDRKYSITLEDLSQRRLSLLSSLLSNMRAHIQHLEDMESMELSSTKHEYRELIQMMMSSMKENYKELGNGGTSAQGAYVDFVHRVVGFLQQHTRDICPIDPFFTDPATFPLPSTDPTYIVARLKSYEPKLASEKVAKTLIIFVQGVSERAAIDGQQMYLVQQLHASMTDTYEAGDPSKPTLRAILLQSVFPAYLETTFTNPAAWMLSRPVTQSITQTFQELLFHMDTTDPHCVASVVTFVTTVFRSSYTTLYSLIENNTPTLQDPPAIVTASSFIDMITSSLKVADFINRATSTATHLVSQIHAFETLIIFIACTLHNQTPATEDLPPSPSSLIFTPPSPTITTTPPFFHEIYHSATRELQSYLNESWSRHNAKYYFTRRGGHHPQEVALEPAVAAQLELSHHTCHIKYLLRLMNHSSEAMD
ncbi:Mus7/MMS22 family-domain-containing protein [Aspergillus taichungensis]|uniref:Mus7/MMS22 family-domain-containing protein n=1 Tax=Aspergillus taichungensis TaxID=482145 RepID=A0A2J5HUI6_9EURO|nr:Mus7/MMS22 family-domain-containing protein [Aspergillus taichungensis]